MKSCGVMFGPPDSPLGWVVHKCGLLPGHQGPHKCQCGRQEQPADRRR